jgi:ATP-dependent Lon protease
MNMNYANESEKKDHWEKYHLYYLIFGSFVLTTLLILIINISISRRINNYSSTDYSGFDFQSKINDYSSRLNSEPFPDYVKERVKGEINKIKKSSGGSIKEIREEYVEQVMSFPWHQVSPENDNLTEIEQALEKNHYGMKKTKEAIIEYLAGKKQSGKNFGKVICLVGPPGTGKTSIVRSIAEALGRPFEKVSLGGVHDEGEIRGHRNTYISAKPGIIVRACQRAKVKNPVIIADEIEKMGKSEQHGDPAAAFLEILDPEQNEKFSDHYIELPIDLSQIMFVCTANRIDTIPKPLLDRMEIIEIPAYTENEKLNIAKKYLIPKLFSKYNKLTEEQLTFEDLAIQKIIKDYTLEPGVRNLDRKLDKIFEKFSEQLIKKEKEKLVVSPEILKDYLGNPEVPDLSSEVDYNKPGVVNGLSVLNPEIGGGNVLPIEVIIFSGKGEITITGNLKETMKESINIAISYIKKNAKTFGVEVKIQELKDKDIHIDVPKGGIPKDGPSAGTAFTTAIISALIDRIVPWDIGMTGTIGLNGEVNIIGGLQEKFYAAHQRGLKKVFIPEKNKKDLDDIPAEIKSECKPIPVSKYQDIWDNIKNELITLTP